ncbi:MAG: hypothetical protein MI802_27235 [Desulfobacterales bacterium]|nr:hypothetical protein [Desulfobacterales bacterium]
MRANIIVDTCSYFRLAQSIHPLLKRPFCEEKHVLGVIRELDEEYYKNQTLRHKFFWVNETEYLENRKRCFALTHEQKSDINNSFYYLRDTAREEGYGVSKVDLRAISFAEALSIPLVTDDTDMLLLAQEYDIKTFTSLEIMKLIYDCGAIDMNLVRSVANYWVHLADTPASFGKSYQDLFKEAAPR